MSTAARILLVDDHPIVCAMLTELIKVNPGTVVCGCCGSLCEALTLLQSSKPTMAVIDISLADGNGLNLIRKIKQFKQDIKILVMSGHEEAVFSQRAFDEGAQGYINKQASLDEILKAINCVAQGEYYLPQAALQNQPCTCQQKPGFAASGKPALSCRELEVIALMARGLTHANIAQSLNISTKTLDSHKGNMKKKLNLKTTHDLSRYAQQWQVAQG